MTASDSPGQPPDREPESPKKAANSESLYQRLVESVSDYAIYMLSPEGLVSSWNRGAELFKGYKPDEIIGQHFSKFYTEQDRKDGRPQLALDIANREGRFEDKAWRVRKDGKVFRAHVVIDAIRNDDGSLHGYAKITRDISVTYQQELELRESEQRFRLLVSGVTDYAIYMLDLQGNINSWNAGAERFKNYKEHEVLGRHFSMFYTRQDAEAGKPKRALRNALEHGRYENQGWRVRKDGGEFWAHVIIDLIKNEQGEPVGFAKITRDVTEFRKNQIRLDDLIQANKEMEQFIQIASHDLREPLRKVSSYSELLLMDEGQHLSPQANDYIHKIVSTTERMQGLLRSLLNLTKITTHGQTFARCNLNEVLREVIADLELAISDSGASIEVGEFPYLDADAAQMRQLLQNLIENSLKYAQQDGPPLVRIHPQASSDEEHLIIRYEDNGIGFENKFNERIFGLFQRLHTRDQYDGAGVGLAICRKICNRHGGDITAEGEPGTGAVFIIKLKLKHGSRSSAHVLQ